MIGGLVVDDSCRTTVPGLWAVGECSSSGLHGANRMGSNSLLEGLVLGQRAGVQAAAHAVERGRPEIQSVAERASEDLPPGVEVNLADLTYSMKSLMWRQMGVERTREGMEDALETFAFWARAAHSLPFEDPRAIELFNMLTVARLMTTGGLAREESRGTHFRSDFVHRNDGSWRVHLVQQPVGKDGAPTRGGRIQGLKLIKSPVRVAPETAAASTPNP